MTFETFLSFIAIFLALPSAYFSFTELYDKTSNYKKSISILEDTYKEIYIPLFNLMVNNSSQQNINIEETLNTFDAIIKTSNKFIPNIIICKYMDFNKLCLEKNDDEIYISYNNLLCEIYRNYCIYKSALYKEPNRLENSKNYTKAMFYSVFTKAFFIIEIICLIYLTISSFTISPTKTTVENGTREFYYIYFFTIIIATLHLLLYNKMKNNFNEKYEIEYLFCYMIFLK